MAKVSVTSSGDQPSTNMAKDLQLEDQALSAKYRDFRDQAKFYYNMRGVNKVLDASFNGIENVLYRNEISKPIVAPIFLLGNFRSGTSFFEKVIADHRDVGHFTYGSQVFPRSPIITGAAIRKFAFFNKPMVPVHMPSSVNAESPYEAEPIWRFCKNNCWTDDAVNILDQNFSDPAFEKIFRTAIQKSLISQKKKRFLNKNPWNTLRVGYLSKLFPDAKFLYITRHPNRQLRSQLDLEKICQKVLGGLEHFNEAFSDQFFPPRVFFRTNSSARYIDLYSRNKPLATAMSIVDFDEEFDAQVKSANVEDRLFRIRYEDLVENFAPMLDDVFDFLDLGQEDARRVIEKNEASYLKRNLVSSTSRVPEFDDEVNECLSTLHRKHGYAVS